MGNYKTGFILLLVIIFTSNVVPAFRQQNSYSTLQLAYNSRLYEQHVFSGIWQFQHLHKAVHLRYFGNERRHKSFDHREKYHHAFLQPYYLDTWPNDVIRKAAIMDIRYQQHAS